MSPHSPDLRLIAEGRVGCVFKKKWRLDRLIDIGGVASVYAAAHRNGKRLAIKVLHPAFALDQLIRDRFLREGYAANTVDHPGAVSVLDDDVSEQGDVFLVMELLRGESLSTRLRNCGGRIPYRDILDIADQVLDVLVSAHKKGIVHRDIKPANIFITVDDTVKLLDFGLARLQDPPDFDEEERVTAPGIILGTSTYMPPEQAWARSDVVDGRSDLFAVGAVMFRAITGDVVHAGETVNDRLHSAMHQNAPSLRSLVPDAPAPIVHIVDRALAFDMRDRWPDAQSMQTAVREALCDIPQALITQVIAPPLLGPPPTVRMSPRPNTLEINADDVPSWNGPATVRMPRPRLPPSTEPRVPRNSTSPKARSIPAPKSLRPKASGTAKTLSQAPGAKKPGASKSLRPKAQSDPKGLHPKLPAEPKHARTRRFSDPKGLKPKTLTDAPPRPPKVPPDRPRKALHNTRAEHFDDLDEISAVLLEPAEEELLGPLVLELEDLGPNSNDGRPGAGRPPKRKPK